MDNEIHRYTPLVRAIARRYYRAGRAVDPALWTPDAIDELGQIGVWNALRKYDPNGLHRNYAENTIVAFGIKAEIRKALRLANHGVEVAEEEEEGAPDIADQPTMPLPIRPPAWMLGRDTQPLLVVPLELPDPAPSVEEQVVAAVAGAQISATLEAALLLLSARQRTIIERRFGLSGDGACWTLEEIGHLLGRHRSNIYRQQVKGLAILRAHLSESRDGQIILHRFEEKRQRRVKTRAA